MDYKTVFTNLCLELQQNRSWIKGLGKNSFTHSIPFTHSLTAVPFVRGHRSVFPRTPRNTGVYTRHPACLHAVRHAVEKKIACIHGLRSEGVKHRTKLEWLNSVRRVPSCLMYANEVYWTQMSYYICKLVTMIITFFFFFTDDVKAEIERLLNYVPKIDEVFNITNKIGEGKNTWDSAYILTL